MAMHASESSTQTDPLPPALAEFVRRFVLRSRQLRLLETGGVAIAFVLIWTLLWSLVDRFAATPAWFRCVLLLIEVIAAGGTLIRPVGKLLSNEVPWQRAAAEIEERDPHFGGRLQTALSQLLMPNHQRGSASLLAQVLDEASARATTADARSLLPSAKALRPSLVAATALASMCMLFAFSWLDMPRLIVRELFPFSNAAPVTTTRLLVTPGSVEIIEGTALKIGVRAERLGDSQPLLQWRGDDPVFSSAVMLPEPGGFSYTFPSVDRPLTYRVSGGDAASALFEVHLIARPTVRQLRVSYAYPDWTELRPTPAEKSNGDLEGPTGTTATLSIVANQSISGAACVFEGTRIESIPSVDPAVRVLIVPLATSGPWNLELTSATGIAGSGPSGMTVRVAPPQPPQATLRLPSNEDELRLHPRDVLTLGYEATDQFALEKISAQITVNAAPPMNIAIPLGANHRAQSGSFDIDLAELGVNLGDVVTITVTAENKARLHKTSNPCRIVISPASIDLNAEQRLSELRDAARLAKEIDEQIIAASKALEQSPSGDDKESRDDQLAPHLAVADGVAPGLSRQLLRALTHSNRVELSSALVWMIDATQRSASGIEAADAVLTTEMRDPLRDRLNRLMDITGEVQRSLDSFSRGEFAAQLLAESEDARADEARVATLAGAQADAVRRSAQQARADQKAGCALLGIDPSAADVESQLQRHVDEGSDLLRRYGPIDFAGAAGEWSSAGPDVGTGLVARLTVASEAESVRPGGDFIWARDLQLSARAARRIDTSNAPPAGARKDFPAALRSLQQMHVMVVARTPPLQMVDPMKEAQEARRRMRLWAGDVESTSQPSATQMANDPERAALETAAAEALQKLDQDARLEHNNAVEPNAAPPLDLPPTPNGTPDAKADSTETPADVQKLKQAVASARQLERLAAEQRLLRRQTGRAPDADLQELARQQAALTDAIQNAKPVQADQPREEPPQSELPRDSREAGMNAIRSAQERLLDMPKQIDAARKAEVQQHAAADRADQAQQDANASDPDTKPAARQFADQARKAADAAKADASAQQVSPDDASNLAASLHEFAPEATPAVEAIEQQLTPALTAMRQTQSAGDDQGNQRAAQQATQAVAEAQRRLSDGLQNLLKRDALTTAKFFSNQAAQALAKPQPDRAGALKLQRGASAALEQAWDNALHDAAGQRLARMPSLFSILRLYPTEGGATVEGSMGAEPAPAEREWGRLREQQPMDLSAGSHESDPPEYQDALRVYFRDLAREDAGVKP